MIDNCTINFHAWFQKAENLKLPHEKTLHDINLKWQYLGNNKYSFSVLNIRTERSVNGVTDFIGMEHLTKTIDLCIMLD